MQKFKTADSWISIILITCFGIMSFFDLEKLIVGYFVVGGWQVISMLAHQANGWFTEKGNARYFYHRLVLLLIIASPLAYFLESLVMPFLFTMAIMAPVMAIYYSTICFHELSISRRRPLDALK